MLLFHIKRNVKAMVLL